MSPTREQILTAVDLHAQELRRLGARSLALFGSIARGEGCDSSDIDLLVELEPKTFDAYMDVKLFLEKVLGRKTIDAVVRNLEIIGEAAKQVPARRTGARPRGRMAQDRGPA